MSTGGRVRTLGVGLEVDARRGQSTNGRNLDGRLAGRSVAGRRSRTATFKADLDRIGKVQNSTAGTHAFTPGKKRGELTADEQTALDAAAVC